MRRTALPLAVVVWGTIVGAVLFPTVAAAGSDSTADSLIGAHTDQLILLGATVAVIVEVALLYALLRYRDSGDAQPPEPNPRFHASYVLAVGLILFFVGVASLQTFGALDQQRSQPLPDDAVRADVEAEQWAWNFEYPGHNVSTQGTLVIPANRTVRLRITSSDVIHSFHAPDLGLKRDASPAQRNNVTFTPTATGEYDLLCAEFCGQGHSTMLGTIRVVNGSEYDRWLERRTGSAAANRTA